MPADSDHVEVDRSLVDLIPFFFENRRGRLTEALTLCDAGDLDSLHRLGHDFKGACGSYGFFFLSHQGAELNDVESVEGARELIFRMLDYLDNVRVDYV